MRTEEVTAQSALVCLTHLEDTALHDCEQLAELNNKFVDVIVHFHYLQAENEALNHAINFLKTGAQNNTNGINTIVENEIKTARESIEDSRRRGQHLRNEEAVLKSQIDEWQKKWRDQAPPFGIPDDVDAQFIRLSQLEAENNLYLRRIKYIEEKNRHFGKDSSVAGDINLMRIRKDQADHFSQELRNRQHDLLASIKNIKDENARIIMNEHKYFKHDSNKDYQHFRDQLHEPIMALRRESEQQRLRNRDEIKLTSEKRITLIRSQQLGINRPDENIEELKQIRLSVQHLKQKIDEVNGRNETLLTQIELIEHQITEENDIWKCSLEEKDAFIRRIKAECEKLVIELQKICDLNLSLTAEIEKYRKLLDGTIEIQGARTASTVRHYPTRSLRTDTHLSSTSHSRRISTDFVSNVVDHTSTRFDAPVIPPIHPIQPVQTIQPAQSGHSIHSTHSIQSIQPSQPYIPSVIRPTSRTDTNITRDSTIIRDTTTTNYNPYAVTVPEPLPSIPSIPIRDYSSHIDTGIHISSTRSAEYRPSSAVEISHQHESRDIRSHGDSTSVIQNTSTIVNNTLTDRQYATQTVDLVYRSDESSSDEDDFQRFTRWYKGRVKISDVTPDFIQIENRSAKHAADIGSFKIIHEFGQSSVFTTLPVGLILQPKTTLKIFARNSKHEHRSIVAEIDEFDTSNIARTALRNTNNEERAWFVYISNTEKDTLRTVLNAHNHI